jgi:diguanylate cyclase (GGDEF)-like protein
MFSFQTARQLLVLGAILSFFFLIHGTILCLNPLQREGMLSPQASVHLTFLLFGFTLPILAGWISHRKWIAIPVGGGALFMSILVVTATRNGLFLSFGILYLAFYGLLSWFDKESQTQVLLNEVEIEKSENERNQLEVRLNKVKEELESSLAKYDTYSGLREVAEKFASTLSLNEIAEHVVKETRSFVPKGEAYLLYLAESDGASLSLIASYTAREEEKIKAKKGDFFDLWVLKNRKPLFIRDITKDIFFDAKQIADSGNFRSVMITPLVSEGRVVGVFRIHSTTPEHFVMDDLRLLDFIGDLACSAISNAILYQKTEELAIRDSLTGLYVQHYFKERFKEEHRRALLTNTKLSVLMCDLDRFKGYNDTFGHAAGDMILMRIADILREQIRDEGIVARYGGEEFTVLLPRISKEEARQIAERIRQGVEAARIEVRREPTHITLSIGVSTMPDDTLEREELIRKADQFLYDAKRGGRNRICA